MIMRRPLLAVAIASTFVLACSEPDVTTLTGDPLNPELHRAELVAIDAVLFEDGPLSDEGRTQVADSLEALAKVAEADGTNTIANVYAKEMRTLGSRVTRSSVGTPLANSDLRTQWLRIRGSLFNDAAWFRRSSADPIEPVVPGPAPPGGLRPATADERRRLDDVLISLTELLSRAKDDLPNASDSEERRRLSTDLQRELMLDVERLGPLPGVFDIDNFYRGAQLSATGAIGNLRALAGLDARAPRTSREYLIQKAEEQLDKAREDVKHLLPLR